MKCTLELQHEHLENTCSCEKKSKLIDTALLFLECWEVVASQGGFACTNRKHHWQNIATITGRIHIALSSVCKRSRAAYKRMVNDFPVVGDIFTYGPNNPFVSNREYRGISLVQNVDEPVVECWFTSDVCDNWGRHRHDLLIRDFDECIPLRLLAGKKEGDVLEIFMCGRRMVLTLACLKYKYRKYGPFENMLRTVADR